MTYTCRRVFVFHRGVSKKDNLSRTVAIGIFDADEVSAIRATYLNGEFELSSKALPQGCDGFARTGHVGESPLTGEATSNRMQP